MHFYGHQNTFFFSCLDMGGSDIPGIQGDFIILQKKERKRITDTCLEKNQKAIPCSAPAGHPVSAEDEKCHLQQGCKSTQPSRASK